MTAGELAAVFASVAVTVLAVGLLFTLRSLTRTLRSLRQTVDDVRTSALPLLTELHGTVGQASAELERVDALLGTAESISTTVDSASRLAYLAFSNPVVKVLAFGAGAGRFARRLRPGSRAKALSR